MRSDGLALLLAGALAACAPQPPAAEVVAPAAAARCTIGRDDGPGPLAERGLGGTGGPVRLASDRGIGGTGIIGVITGFGSVCVAGQEVALDADAQVRIGGRRARAEMLRAGDFAVVIASGSGAGLRASAVTVRYDVVGRVAERRGEALMVAGQAVTIDSRTRGIAPEVGRWVAVSGLRRLDGGILATRIDPAEPGRTRVDGVLEAMPSGALQLGQLPVASSATVRPLVGRWVALSGRVVDGTLVVSQAEPDALYRDPDSYFGPQIVTVLFETFTERVGATLQVGPSLETSAPASSSPGGRRSIVEFQREDGRLTAVGEHTAQDGGAQPPSRSGPAPAGIAGPRNGRDAPGPDGSAPAPGGLPPGAGGPGPGGAGGAGGGGGGGMGADGRGR